MPKTKTAFAHSRSAMLVAAASGSLPEYVSDAFPGDGEHWDRLVRHAAAAHRTGQIDLIEIFAQPSEDPLSYGCQQFLEDVLPKLKFDQAQVLQIVVGLTGRSNGSQLPYYLSDWFSSWSEGKSSRPWSLLEAIKSGSAPEHLRHSVYHSGLKVNRRRFLPTLVRILESGEPNERWTAASLLGRFNAYQPNELDRAVAALRAAIRREAGDGVVAPLRSLLHVAATTPGKEQEGIAAIADCTSRMDEDVRSAIASEMMFAISKAPVTLTKSAFAALMTIAPGGEDAVDAIDQIISKTLNGPLAGEAHALLDHLLVSRTTTMKKLDSTARTILESDPAIRSQLIGSWLRSPSFRHFDAVLDICRGIGENTPKFEIDMSGWSEDETLRAIRRSSAILLAFPGTLASILVSALRTAPIRIRRSAEHLIFDPLLMTFWTASRSYLEKAVKSGPRHAREAIKRVLAAHDRYRSDIEAANEIKELAPSEHHRVLVDQKHREESRAMSKNAMEMSIFGKIFPTSMMLYGDAAIHDVYLADEEAVRQETPMVSRGISTETLRYDMLEPFWARYRRDLLLRGETDE